MSIDETGGLARMYVDEGLSIREIVRRTGKTFHAVRRALLAAGVELRPPGLRREPTVIDGVHGKLWTYRRGCGCVPCREANTATDRAYRVRRAIRDSAR